ncbi:RecX family transcriptional regulator [Cellulosilyticum sp. ST5]|uniref:Regulatory protein RecX n=1 Tax=Cellulosilyticum lentocellum (strain ATCC 49066 / DSM 5427 / NCIMB 11756 / RHM5) TaxID=642492 RepID=F2JI86_CELLD|nr:RecX family transcriptional regulator [Cellulosilyticum lentocellum]ADZ83114.1 regulatory protein RecX [Cellulosilyticum lentocellum DSM 5427]
MKTITKISRQQNGERYNIFLDEVFFCGVTEDTLIRMNLKKGAKIDEEALKALEEEESKNRCFSYAIYLLGRQNYFEKVLVEKLKRKEYSEEDIQYTLEKLRYYNYLDDSRLTEAFVRDKKRFSKKGPRYIAEALRNKGVSQEQITKALEENYSTEEAYENCIGIAEKKLEYYKKKTDDLYQLKSKLYAFLAQRGFSSEVIKRTIEELTKDE